MTRDRIPLPDNSNGFKKILLLGTTGAGKTTLVRQLIGTDPRTERFPSTSAAKTTTCDVEIITGAANYAAVITFLSEAQVTLLTEECISAAAIAAAAGGSITAKLLEHPEQRFRLSYILGNPTATVSDAVL